MKNYKKMLGLTIIILCFCVSVANAVKIYVPINTDGNYITNVPTPIADTHAVNKRYAHQTYAANALNALPAKCAGGQISGYTPIAGEDLHSGMQHGVDWSTNTRFTVDSTGSNVYDNLTGLMWTKNANIDGKKTWTNAITYCNDLVYGGYSDCRLPNRKELMSLVDYSKYNPVLPNGHPFSDVRANDYYLMSSTYAGNSDFVWSVRMNYGYAFNHEKIYSYFVWPVRAGR